MKACFNENLINPGYFTNRRLFAGRCFCGYPVFPNSVRCFRKAYFWFTSSWITASSFSPRWLNLRNILTYFVIGSGLATGCGQFEFAVFGFPQREVIGFDRHPANLNRHITFDSPADRTGTENVQINQSFFFLFHCFLHFFRRSSMLLRVAVAA